MEREKASLLTSFNGAIPLNGTITIPEGININAIAAGYLDVLITSIRINKIDKPTTIYKYKVVGESIDWDGKTLSAYDVLTIPDRYRLYSITIDNQVQGILQNTISFEEE